MNMRSSPPLKPRQALKWLDDHVAEHHFLGGVAVLIRQMCGELQTNRDRITVLEAQLRELQGKADG